MLVQTLGVCKLQMKALFPGNLPPSLIKEKNYYYPFFPRASSPTLIQGAVHNSDSEIGSTIQCYLALEGQKLLVFHAVFLFVYYFGFIKCRSLERIFCEVEWSTDSVTFRGR